MGPCAASNKRHLSACPCASSFRRCACAFSTGGAAALAVALLLRPSSPWCARDREASVQFNEMSKCCMLYEHGNAIDIYTAARTVPRLGICACRALHTRSHLICIKAGLCTQEKLLPSPTWELGGVLTGAQVSCPVCGHVLVCRFVPGL